MTRLAWPGAVIVTAAGLLPAFPWLFRVPLVLMLLYPVVGMAAGVTGVAVAQRRQRLGVLGAAWLGAGLSLFYLFTLTLERHETADLILGAGLLVTFVVLGPVTAALLPPDQDSHNRNGG